MSSRHAALSDISEEAGNIGGVRMMVVSRRRFNSLSLENQSFRTEKQLELAKAIQPAHTNPKRYSRIHGHRY
jgi:hypothetical protein